MERREGHGNRIAPSFLQSASCPIMSDVAQNPMSRLAGEIVYRTLCRTRVGSVVVASVILSVAGIPENRLGAQQVPTLNSSGPGLWSSPRLVEELRVGRLDGPDEYIFGRVAFLAPSRNGSIFVLDDQGPRLRLYSSDGTYLRDVGRIGEGPGEYQQIVGIGMTPADELAVFDVALARISFFSSEGDFLRSVPSHTGGNWRADAFRVDTEGDFLVYTARYATVFDPRTGRQIGVGPEGSDRTLYLRVSSNGEILDSLAIPVSTRPRRRGFVVMTSEGNLTPFGDELQYAPSPEGYIVAGYTTEYAIHRLDRGGTPLSRFLRPYEPVRLARRERSEWQARADYYSRRPRAPAQGAIPDVKPAFRRLEVDEDGRIWVHRYVRATERVEPTSRRADGPPPITWREVPTFDVFEPTGRFLGTVVVPPNTRLFIRRGDQAWGVTRGEFDEDYVVRFRLETGS